MHSAPAAANRQAALQPLTEGTPVVHAHQVVPAGTTPVARPWFACGCSSVVEHLLAKERVESSNLFIRLKANLKIHRRLCARGAPTA